MKYSVTIILADVPEDENTFTVTDHVVKCITPHYKVKTAFSKMVEEQKVDSEANNLPF